MVTLAKAERLEIRLDPLIDGDIITFLNNSKRDTNKPKTKIIKAVLRSAANQKSNSTSKNKEISQEINEPVAGKKEEKLEDKAKAQTDSKAAKEQLRNSIQFRKI